MPLLTLNRSPNLFNEVSKWKLFQYESTRSLLLYRENEFEIENLYFSVFDLPVNCCHDNEIESLT